MEDDDHCEEGEVEELAVEEVDFIQMSVGGAKFYDYIKADQDDGDATKHADAACAAQEVDDVVDDGADEQQFGGDAPARIAFDGAEEVAEVGEAGHSKSAAAGGRADGKYTFEILRRLCCLPDCVGKAHDRRHCLDIMDTHDGCSVSRAPGDRRRRAEGAIGRFGIAGDFGEKRFSTYTDDHRPTDRSQLWQVS